MVPHVDLGSIDVAGCVSALERLKRGEKVSMSEVRSAIGRDMEHRLNHDIEQNRRMAAQDKDNTRLLRGYVALVKQYHLATERALRRRISHRARGRAGAQIADTRDKMAEELDKVFHSHPQARGALPTSYDLDEPPRQIRWAISFAAIKQQILSEAIDEATNADVPQNVELNGSPHEGPLPRKPKRPLVF